MAKLPGIVTRGWRIYIRKKPPFFHLRSHKNKIGSHNFMGGKPETLNGLSGMGDLM